jgi:hypothetical protein
LIDRTILKPAVEAIDKQFKDQPVVDAALRQVLADRYRQSWPRKFEQCDRWIFCSMRR